jgi:hypothetical protein
LRGCDPTIVSYNASAVKTYLGTSCPGNDVIFFKFAEKFSGKNGVFDSKQS